MRPYREEFLGPLHEAAVESVETVGQWLPWCHAGYSERDAATWLARCEASWEAGEEYEFALFDHAGEYVGGAGLNQFRPVHNLANLGYWVRQSRQGQGLIVEAIQRLTRFGFETLGLTRIEIVTVPDNLPSRRVAEKAGATFECFARNRLILCGTPITAAVYSFAPKC
jgi:ribosomal-protein-serine acetyltransferase